MNLVHRLIRAGVAATVMGLAMTGAFAGPAGASAPAPGYVALDGSMLASHAARTGSYSSSRMAVEVALAPRDENALNAQLKAMYTKGSGSYHHWLAKGQFDALYAPAAATRSAIVRYLTQSGLTVQPSASPFLVRAEGTSQRVSAVFGTTLSSYRAPDGAQYFANSTAVRLPAAVAPGCSA